MNNLTAERQGIFIKRQGLSEKQGARTHTAAAFSEVDTSCNAVRALQNVPTPAWSTAKRPRTSADERERSAGGGFFRYAPSETVPTECRTHYPIPPHSGDKPFERKKGLSQKLVTFSTARRV